MAMDADAADAVVFEAPAHFRFYKSGRIERLNRPPILPAGVDEATGVTSKDVVLDAGTGLSVRLYLPSSKKTPRRSSRSSTPAPACPRASSSPPAQQTPPRTRSSPSSYSSTAAASSSRRPSPRCTTATSRLAAPAGVLAVSVECRLAPEHPVPAAYGDAWAALRWAAAAQDEWLAEHGDGARLFLAGDSAGGNIVHNVLIRASFEPAPRVEGAILLHLWFGGSAAVDGEAEATARDMAMIWEFACPGAVGGADDPRMNPMAPGAPGLENLRCDRMLVCGREGLGGGQGPSVLRGGEHECVARELVARELVARCVAWVESEGEGHVFFLQKPGCAKLAKELMDRVVAFIAGY